MSAYSIQRSYHRNESSRFLGNMYREAEEVVTKTPRPHLLRQLSAHHLDRCGDLENLSQKSGYLWDCVKRIPNKLGGFIFKFKLKEEYDDITIADRGEKIKRWCASLHKQGSIFPAIEKRGCRVLDWDPKMSREKWLEHIVDDEFNNAFTITLKNSKSNILCFDQRCELIWNNLKSSLSMENFKERIDKSLKIIPETPSLLALGYKSRMRKKGLYLYIPDREAVLANWEKLRETRPSLPVLNILSSNGIADDAAFVTAFLAHGILLSDEKEFLHDSLQHVVPSIILMLKSDQNGNPNYHAEKFLAAKLIISGYRTIMITKRVLEKDSHGLLGSVVLLIKTHIPKIEAALAALADYLSNFSNYKLTMNGSPSEANKFVVIWDSPDWKNYWSQRFGEANMNYDLLKSVWNQMLEISKTDFSQPPS